MEVINMTKFFLCNFNDSPEELHFENNTMVVHPCIVTSENLAKDNDHYVFTPDNNVSLNKAYLFTEDTLKAMGSVKLGEPEHIGSYSEKGFVKLPVTQEFLDNCPCEFIDTAPDIKADTKLPQYPDSTEIIILHSNGFMSDEEMPSMYREIKETANESVDLAIAWDPNCFHRQQIANIRSDNDDLRDYLANSKEYMLEAGKYNGNALEYASDDLKNDKDIVLTAVKQYGSSVKYVSDKLKNDKDIALAAVSQNGNSVRYLSKEMRSDKDVAKAAITQNEGASRYVSKTVLNDFTDSVDGIKNPDEEITKK